MVTGSALDFHFYFVNQFSYNLVFDQTGDQTPPCSETPKKEKSKEEQLTDVLDQTKRHLESLGIISAVLCFNLKIYSKEFCFIANGQNSKKNSTIFNHFKTALVLPLILYDHLKNTKFKTY